MKLSKERYDELSVKVESFQMVKILGDPIPDWMQQEYNEIIDEYYELRAEFDPTGA